MHEEFYLNNKLTKTEEINSLFSSGEQIKDFLSKHELRCGYYSECNAELRSAILSKTNLVYLRSKRKSDHLINCPFHDLVRLKEKLIKNKNLNFLIKSFPKRTRSIIDDEFNKLIASKYKGIYISLAELFDLLKNDFDLRLLKESSFIDPDYCKEWYEKSHFIEDNAVLLTGVLHRKFYSCELGDECSINNGYDCVMGHEPRDYKLELIENDIEFHISVTKEIYDLIGNELVGHSSKEPKKYHILAKINEMKNSNLKNKRFYTKHNKKTNHVVKNKRFVELIVD